MAAIVTSISNFEEFVAASLSEDICLTAIAIKSSGANFPTKTLGQIVVRNGRFAIQFRTSPKRPRKLNFRRGAVAVEPITWARILIDGHLYVRAEHIFPGQESHISGGTSYYEFEIRKISYEEGKMRRSTTHELEMRALLPSTSLQASNTQKQTLEEWSDESPGTETIRREALSGQIGRYLYSFRQQGEDILILIRLEKGKASRTSAEDRKFFRALLLAFNWVNGGTPFERHLSHRREYNKFHIVSNRWDGPVPKSRLIAQDFDGSLSTKILSITTTFFLAKGIFNDGVKLLLWQYREAVNSNSITLGKLLQICSLLEGLTGLILRHLCGLSKSGIDKLPAPAGGRGRPGSAEARFYEAGARLGFNWHELEPVFLKWKDVRNQLAHGELSKITQTSGSETIANYHIILQAFNCLLLRSIGYQEDLALNGGWFAIQ